MIDYIYSLYQYTELSLYILHHILLLLEGFVCHGLHMTTYILYIIYIYIYIFNIYIYILYVYISDLKKI